MAKKKSTSEKSAPAAVVESGGGRPLVTCRPAQCPSCKSSRRAPFRDGPLATMQQTIEIDGLPYNRETWHNTKCVDCGQRYRIIEYRYEPD